MSDIAKNVHPIDDNGDRLMCEGLRYPGEELLEDEDGAPYPEMVQELVRWLRVSVEASDRTLARETALPTERHQEKLVAYASMREVYQEVLDKLKELA